METRPGDSRVGSPPARRDDGVTAVSSVAYGFMGSQALFTALEVGITRAMSDAGFVEGTVRPHIPDITFAFSGRCA